MRIFLEISRNISNYPFIIYSYVIIFNLDHNIHKITKDENGSRENVRKVYKISKSKSKYCCSQTKLNEVNCSC